MKHLPVLKGVVYTARAVVFDDDRGWSPAGDWFDGDRIGSLIPRVIRPGTDAGTDWLVTLGSGHHYQAEVFTTCVVCGDSLDESTATSDGRCLSLVCQKAP